jgi:hypothetical protein
MARREVAPGQKYQQTGSVFVWQVIDVVKDAEGIQHARMIRVGDATTRKTISVPALRDSRLYKLVPG